MGLYIYWVLYLIHPLFKWIWHSYFTLIFFFIDLEDEDVPMMECSNTDCENGRWFHFQCVGLAELRTTFHMAFGVAVFDILIFIFYLYIYIVLITWFYLEIIENVGTFSDANPNRQVMLAVGRDLHQADWCPDHSRKDTNRLSDMMLVIKMLISENLTEFVPNREHKNFKIFAWPRKINVNKYMEKKDGILSEKLESRRNVIAI